MLKMILMDKFKNWMTESANILFDDSKNDLRALPKSVRLQILLVLSLKMTTHLLVISINKYKTI